VRFGQVERASVARAEISLVFHSDATAFHDWPDCMNDAANVCDVIRGGNDGVACRASTEEIALILELRRSSRTEDCTAYAATLLETLVRCVDYGAYVQFRYVALHKRNLAVR
jgi:hypothetical protein